MRIAAVDKNAQYRWRVKAEALAAYGGACALCGERSPACLTIDHPLGNGGEERRMLFGDNHSAGYQFHLWLKRNDFPPGYRVLCFNCNIREYHKHRHYSRGSGHAALKAKLELHAAMGGCCQGCGEADPDVLCINGRMGTGKHGADLYRYLLASGEYRHYTLRCYNCTRSL
jgi:hypothetical protein